MEKKHRTECRMAGRIERKTADRMTGRTGQKTADRMTGRTGQKTADRMTGRTGQKTADRMTGRTARKTEDRMTRRTTLKRRFVVWYTCLVLIPIALLSVFFVRTSFQHFEETVSYGSQFSFLQTSQLLEYYINNVNDTINNVLGTEEFRKLAEKDNSDVGYQEQVRDMLYIRDLLNSCCSKSEISDVYLYLDNEAIYIGENAQIRSLDSVSDELWYSYVVASYPGAARIPSSYLDNPSVVGYAKAIRSTKNYTKTVGILFFQMNKNLLTSYLGESETAHISIVNENGDLITANHSQCITVPVSTLKDYSDGEYHMIELDKRTYWLFAKKLDKTDWYLTYMEPYDTTYEVLLTQGVGYVLLFVVVLVMGLLFFYLFFRYYIRRVTDMTKHMSKIRETLPALMEPSSHGDEIDDLVQSYNYMLGRVETLMKEQYELGNQIKEIEMKALYEQINPHFLYNTLTMINWLAEDGQTEDVTRVISALSAFYRLSLNKGNENIYLKEELEIARNFIYIQQMRFGTEICLACQMDPVYDHFVLPKLTLQPLIENSLVHGILMRRDKSGTITVSVTDQAGALVITITDTGMGMDSETVEKLNNGTLQSNGDHYGVWNVLQRASLYYGSPCTLVYSSSEGEGTTAVLTLPYGK
ncbi:MAG: sensor histidine kinase [Lachnospiraceae bacterium]|nr:sensor histidine kinase [Lachnospiraceae bacterium]